MNHRLLNLMDLIMVKNNVCFSQHVIIMDLLDLIMDLLDLIMDLLDHSGFSYENTWSCFHLMQPAFNGIKAQDMALLLQYLR